MNTKREPPNKSMGFFGIYKEAYNLTSSNRKIFSEITLTILFPLSILYLLFEIYLSHFILTEAFPNKPTYRWIVFGITQLVFLILISFALLSTSSVIYTIACFYTSKDITYKKVTRVVWNKLWRRLVVTFVWCFFIVSIYIVWSFCILVLCFAFTYGVKGGWIFVVCLSIPLFGGLTYTLLVWNVATVVTVFEKDYGRKAVATSMRLTKSTKIWVYCAVTGFLEIAFAGITFTFCYLVIHREKMIFVGRVFVDAGCYWLMAIWIHFWLVVQTVVYFVGKSYHYEDVSTVAAHLDVPVIKLGPGNNVQSDLVPPL